MSDLPSAHLLPHWFHDIREEAQAALLRGARKRIFKNGEFVMMQGDANQSIFLVQTGILDCFRSNADGETLRLRLIKPGNTVGQAEFASGTRAQINVKSVGESHVVEYTHAHVLSVGMEFPEVLLGVSNSISRLLSASVEMIDSLVLASPEQRILWRLRILSDHGNPLPDGWISVSVSQSDLAEMVGMTRQSVNRELKALEQKGVLKVQYRTLDVNLAALEKRFE